MRVLVLSGGGSHGAWQAGAVKALAAKYHYDAVVGTSVGAVNAVGLSRSGADGLQRLWASIDGTSRIMRMNIDWPWKLDAVFNFGPLKELLLNAIKETKATIPAYIASLDLETGELRHDLATDDSDYTVGLLLGSCAIAGIQSPTNGRVDGGHRDICPIRFALDELQASEVHAVYAEPIKSNLGMWSRWKYFPILSIMLRALQSMIDEIMGNDVPIGDSRVKVFSPSRELPYSSLSYDPFRMNKALIDGYNEVSELIASGGK